MKDILIIGLLSALGGSIGSSLTIITLNLIHKRRWTKQVKLQKDKHDKGECGCGKKKK